MSDPLFSVVVPTFNRPAHLAAGLPALLGLAAPAGCEILVVDDGGTPPTVLPELQPPPGVAVRLLRQPNAGPGAARNYAARHARGRLLAFTDDDCRPAPGWLEAFAEALMREPDALVGGTTRNAVTRRAGSCTSQLIVELVQAHFDRGPDAFLVPSLNFAVSRDAFLSLGGFDTAFRFASEDRDLSARWRAAGRPLRRAPAALVEHHHDLPLTAFLKQHYAYGRGAWRYQVARRRCGDRSGVREIGLHRALPRLLAKRLPAFPLGLRLRILACLGLWQCANTAGFLAEAVHASRPRP